MTEKEKLALLEETLEVDEGSLKPETLLEGVEEYDSMTKLAIIVMMEDEFGRKITGDTIRNFKTVSDILNLMNKEE